MAEHRPGLWERGNVGRNMVWQIHQSSHVLLDMLFSAREWSPDESLGHNVDVVRAAIEKVRGEQ